MADLPTTSQWIQFFRNASLPLNVAANYAIIFSDNRIHLNMLMDLSKEYLFDMGIRVMGDVIAILRYAKEYHNQLVKEKMIGEKSPVKRDSPTTRMLSHYTRPITVSPKVSESRSTVTFADEPSTIIKSAAQKRGLISLSRQKEMETQAKRFHSHSEEEGAYKIKMPTGSTARSRQILQKQQQQQQQPQMTAKRSVFDRLGDSDVSSSTDVKSSSASVFARLGPSVSISEVSTSSSAMDVDWMSDSSDNQPLQYRGVLKGLSSTSRSTTVRPKTATVVKAMPIGKVALTKSKSVLSPGRRTVLPSARDLATSTVSQVNKILAQNSQIGGGTLRVTRKLTSSGNRQQTVVKSSIADRLGPKRPITKVAVKQSIVGRGKVVTLNKSSGHTFAQDTRQSVFQRLGQ